MKDYSGVFSLGFIVEFVEKYNLSCYFKSRQFKSQCFKLERKIPFDFYVSVMGLDLPFDDLEEFESHYQIYLFEYERYLYRKEKGVL